MSCKNCAIYIPRMFSCFGRNFFPKAGMSACIVFHAGAKNGQQRYRTGAITKLRNATRTFCRQFGPGRASWSSSRGCACAFNLCRHSGADKNECRKAVSYPAHQTCTIPCQFVNPIILSFFRSLVLHSSFAHCMEKEKELRSRETIEGSKHLKDCAACAACASLMWDAIVRRQGSALPGRPS